MVGVERHGGCAVRRVVRDGWEDPALVLLDSGCLGVTLEVPRGESPSRAALPLRSPDLLMSGLHHVGYAPSPVMDSHFYVAG